MARVILGLGGNEAGETGRAHFLREALRLLDARLEIVKVSALYESDAMLPDGAPAAWGKPFLNLCLACETPLEPGRLLDEVKTIERRLGRKAAERWAPREIDIDLLAYEGVALESEQLTLPHPGLLERPFALLPFADVAPDFRLGDRRAAELARKWQMVSVEEVPFRTRRSKEKLVELMGILNATPDSFSDGGRTREQIVETAKILVASGAVILDLGAESTRPGAAVVSSEEEWLRLEPLVPALRELRTNDGRRVRLSVDTRHADVARRAIAAGADWINDVSGGDDEEMLSVVAEAGVAYVFMHHLGVPPSNKNHLVGDAVENLVKWLRAKTETMVGRGLARERLIFDPGIGFGKTLEQTFDVFRNAHLLRRAAHELGVRLLIGHSRKSFLARAIGEKPAAERDAETVAISGILAAKGVDYLRVHDIESHQRSLAASGLSENSFAWEPR